MTKIDRVERILRSGRSITPQQALRFNCFRLAHCIYILKRRGMRINTETVETKTARYAKYSMA